MKCGRKFSGKALLLLVLVALLGAIVMALWNWIMPGLVDGAHAIDYWRAVGLLVLSRILFGGFRRQGGWHRHGQWRRWQRMTQEERDQLRNKATPTTRDDGETGA